VEREELDAARYAEEIHVPAQYMNEVRLNDVCGSVVLMRVNYLLVPVICYRRQLVACSKYF
jgi:hypothetical protein